MTDYSHSSRFISYIVHIFNHIFFSVTISLFISRSGQLKCLSDLGGTDNTCTILPKVDHRNTCDPGHYRLTEILVHLGATETLVAFTPKVSVQQSLHYSGRVPEAVHTPTNSLVNSSCTRSNCISAQVHILYY